ncbi:MAG: hypothetical protein CVU77_07475 [Elusimicrobia bacterium HGW-Elusimicrobia-1]|jgi:NADH-quinone oxidoreductase subunit H|nr:MAG: hypothetical protein CVU77_07475 [Elusimicrobia bacterium HGW-Elusimicrobia-1]
MAEMLFALIVFPGFIFSSALGMLASWFDRKVTARVQYRVGPPFLQPYYDLRKLFAKEITIPRVQAAWLFVAAPVAALAASVTAATLIGSALLLQRGFTGDVILLLYILMIPSIATVAGSLASENPLSSVGASREIKLMLAYEALFILALITAIIKTGSVSLAGMVARQVESGAIISSPSGILAFAAFLVVIMAKLGMVPFDMAEAETELAGGIYMEYSGPLLAFHKLSKTILLSALPIFAVALFFPSRNLWLLVKYPLVVLLLTLVRNTNPRFRIDHAIKLMWTIGIGTGAVAVMLALAGY